MIEKAKNGEYKMIFTKSISRFTRNIGDLIKYTTELKDAGVNVHFDEEGVELLNEGTSLLLTIFGAVAQIEVENTSSHVKHTIRKKMEEGVPVGQPDPYGYDWVDGKLVVNEEQAKIVREIFELYDRGYGGRRIANYLTEKGVPTKHHKRKKEQPSISENQWNDSTIREILRNPKYIGCLSLNQTVTVNPIGRVRKKNTDGELGKIYYWTNTHEAIIDKELFDRVQIKLKQNKELYNNFGVRNTGVSATSYAFTGKLKCAYCGAGLVRHKANNKYVWGCRTYYKQGKRFCLNCKPIHENILEEAVIVSINQMMGDNAFQITEKTLKNVAKKAEEKEKPLKDDLKKKYTSLRKNEAKKTNLVEAFVQKEISKDDYLHLRDKYEKEESQIRREIERIEQILQNNQVLVQKENELIKRIKSYDKTAFDKNVFDALIEYMVIGSLNDPHRISPHFRNEVITDIFGEIVDEKRTTVEDLTPDIEKVYLLSIVENYFGVSGVDEETLTAIQNAVFSSIPDSVFDENRLMTDEERNTVIKKSISQIKKSIPGAKNYTKPIPEVKSTEYVSDNGTVHVECVVGIQKS